MKSYCVVEWHKPFEMIEREDPTPQGREVVVRVRRSGVCHSDVHIWEGYFDYGDGQKFRMEDPPIGKTMLVHPWIGCGKCRACEEERENDCQKMQALGVVRPGGFSTHVVVPDAKFLVDIGDVDPTIAAPYACSGVTVYTALKKLLPIHDDEWLAIMGAGGLGLAAIDITGFTSLPAGLAQFHCCAMVIGPGNVVEATTNPVCFDNLGTPCL